MRIKDLDDIVIFDTFPMAYDPKIKIIITNLLHLEKQTLPQKLPMIYTTNNIAKQLLTYYSAKHTKVISKSNLVIVEPYKFIDIVLNHRRTLQILFCSSENQESRNLMVLIRENGKLDYIYAGNFMDIRFALRNDTFASWITNGVEKLYVNLKRTDEDHNVYGIDQMQKVFNKIEEILNCHKKSKVNICLPLFGYENFIIKLSERFPNRIAKQSTFTMFYFDDISVLQHFCDISNAKIFLYPGGTTNGQIQAELKFKSSNIITINIKNHRSKCVDKVVDAKNPYYELYYSPEPSTFHLKLLCMLVKPKFVNGILDEFNITSKVPYYLKELCVGFKKRTQQMEQKKLSTGKSPLRSTQVDKVTSPTIVIGTTLKKINHNRGPYLSDSDSDGGA